MERIGGAGLLLTSIAIALTASRGGLISSVVVVGLTLYFCTRIPAHKANTRGVFPRLGASLVALIAVLFVVTNFGLLSSSIQATIDRSVQRIVETDNSSGRTEIWASGLIACRTHCLLGAGFGGFESVYDDAQAFSGTLRDVGLNRPAHNVYLGIVVETGILGLALLAVALALEWRTLSSAKLRYLTPALRAALLGLLVASVFLSAIWYKYFWLVFVAIRAAEGASAREVESTEPVAAPSAVSAPLGTR